MRPAKRLLPATALALLAAVLAPAPGIAYTMGHIDSVNKSTYVDCGYFSGFAHWPSNEGTISWSYNPAGQGAGKEDALKAALATWEAAVETDHHFSQVLGIMSGPPDFDDNINTLQWADTSAASLCGKPCHAVTILRYSGQELREADIIFNPLQDWRTDGTSDSCTTVPGAGVKVDTQGVATHELGHSLGLGHSTVTDATMGLASCSAAARSLHDDDRAGPA